MLRLIAGLAFATVLSAGAIAQDKPPASVPIASEAKAQLVELQQQAAGYSRAIAVLQKELDGTAAEFARAVQRLKAAAPAGTELDLATLSYVPKAAPAVKKE